MLEPVDSLKFDIPGEVDELIMTSGSEIGVRCGKELKFYYYDKGWKHNENYDYSFPEDDVSELIITSSNLFGVRRGNVLQFCDIANQYNPVEKGYYTFDYDVDELLITNANELAVRIGKVVKFYKYTETWEPIPELEYTIKKP